MKMASSKHFCAFTIISKLTPYSQLHLNYKECPFFPLANICTFKADLYCSLNLRSYLKLRDVS